MHTERYKFPKTFHLEYSESLQNDDRMLQSTKGLEDTRVIVTEKLDGEGFTLAHDYLHARSVDSKDYLSRHWIKTIHAKVRRDIPDKWRICGENMFALHSIYYTELPSYFLVFSIFNENNDCLCWNETVDYCNLFGLDHVPVLYDGPWDEEKIKECYTGQSAYKAWQPKSGMDFNTFRESITRENVTKNCDIESFADPTQEGYVVRKASHFRYEDFQNHQAKFVRKGHVSTSDNWMTQPVIRNLLKETNNG